MNRKELWFEEMAFNCHQQGYVNGLNGKEALRNLIRALKIRMKHEVKLNTLEFLNEEI